MSKKTGSATTGGGQKPVTTKPKAVEDLKIVRLSKEVRWNERQGRKAPPYPDL